jgi:hypothetical protein
LVQNVDPSDSNGTDFMGAQEVAGLQLAYYVRKREEGKRVPADHAEVEKVREPHEFSHPKDDEYGDHLTEQDTTGGTEKRGETPHQRVHFKCTEVKRSEQVKHLKNDEGGFSV